MIQMILLAMGLSMDSLVIAMTSGAVIGNHKATNVLKISGMLAFIQMGLIIVGWLVGLKLVRYIDQYDHWFAFGILGVLGLKMIWESIKGEEEHSLFNPLDIRVMFTLAVATSIDALAVGLSLSIIGHDIVRPAIIVGLVTLVASAMGVIFGCKAGNRYNFRIGIIGGIILILIGSSILYEHTIGAGNGMVLVSYF